MTYLRTIRIEGTKRLSVQQELELHRAALARDPAPRLMRGRLATLMVQCDRFDVATYPYNGTDRRICIAFDVRPN